VHDNFFELGGDSLIAIRLLRQVKAVQGAEVELADFYRDPTVSGLARLA
jgi:aryl carrier-like protein